MSNYVTALRFAAALTFIPVEATASSRLFDIPQPPITPAELAETVAHQFTIPGVDPKEISVLLDAAFDELSLRPDFMGDDEERRQKAIPILLSLPDAARKYMNEEVKPGLSHSIRSFHHSLPPDIYGGCKGEDSDDVFSYPSHWPPFSDSVIEKDYKSQSHKIACHAFSTERFHSLTLFVNTAAELIALPVATKDMHWSYLPFAEISNVANDAVDDDCNWRPDMSVRERLKYKFNILAGQ